MLGGDKFKFLQNSIPISKKQENIINVQDIEVSQKDIQSMKLQYQSTRSLSPQTPQQALTPSVRIGIYNQICARMYIQI